MYFAHSSPSSSSGVSFFSSRWRIANVSSSIISPTSPESDSTAVTPSPAARSIARWRTAAGSSCVRAIVAAVSASMLTFVAYCSVITS